MNNQRGGVGREDDQEEEFLNDIEWCSLGHRWEHV